MRVPWNTSDEDFEKMLSKVSLGGNVLVRDLPPPGTFPEMSMADFVASINGGENMGKDGAGGDGGGTSCSGSCSCKSKNKGDDTIYDMHISTLTAIDAEMQRLHVLIQRGDGDTDVCQEQLSNLQDELVRLSNIYADKEVE